MDITYSRKHLLGIGLSLAALTTMLGLGPSKDLSAASKAKKKNAPAATPAPLHERSFKEIIDNYTFINDFSVKPELHRYGKEVFWRYPMKNSKPEFPIDFKIDVENGELPRTEGDGREYEHLNEGRALFLGGKYEEAKRVWLAGRARYKKNYPYHRRNDYFLGLCFLKLASEEMKAKRVDVNDANVKLMLVNAATFFSWAFNIKKDNPDPEVDRLSPKFLYNLAAIYYAYERYASVYGMTNKGIEYLRARGYKEYRPQLRRLLAEAYIANRSYLEAIQEFDIALRQDTNAEQASLIFARVGDIYFDLNNFDLAEENYALASQIDREQKLITPDQYIFRGEALFWLGRFDEAIKMLRYAVDTEMRPNIKRIATPDMMRIADLRSADALLALKRFEDARLAYFRINRDYPGTWQAKVARLRTACLDLPAYDGKNVGHARTMLVGLNDDTELPEDARELAFSCEVGSYTQRERSDDMVARVKAFSEKYPESQFLKSMYEPVREVQAEKIEPFFKRGDLLGATMFFEATRSRLYKKVPSDLARRLFTAYVETNQSPKAEEFLSSYKKLEPPSLEKVLRLATFYAEAQGSKPKMPHQWHKDFLAQRDQLMNLASANSLDKEKVKPYLERIIMTPSAEDFVWTNLKIHQTWAKGDLIAQCSKLFTQLSTLSARDGLSMKTRIALQSSLDQTMREIFPSVLEKDESCALSYLDLEMRLYEDDVGELTSRYMARENWSLSPKLTTLFWEVAEKANKARNDAVANRFYRLITEKAPPQSPEVKFAAARLDKTRTESDELWEQ